MFVFVNPNYDIYTFSRVYFKIFSPLYFFFNIYRIAAFGKNKFKANILSASVF